MSDNQQTVVSTELTINGQKFKVSVNVGDFTLTPITDAPPVPDPEKPKDMGTIKTGDKWSTNPGPAETWILKNMDNPPEELKFVSANDGKNIIANIKTKEQATAIQNYFKVNVFPPKVEDGDTTDGPDVPDPDPNQPPGPIEGIEAPYKSTGKQIQSTTRGPTKRNYASGKPSDWTIEKNCKNIPYPNHMMIVDIQVPKAEDMEHDDNLSIKIGGRHMEEGWFDNGISIYEGQTCLGTEKEHPSTKLCIVKGKKYGDIRGKRIQIASTYFKDQNKTEFWVKMPDGANWEKSCEGTNVGGFNPKASEFETQLRIDGFKEEDKPPQIISAVVQEIAV